MTDQPEFVLTLTNGVTLRTETHEANPGGVSYVRACDPDGREIGYWDHAEWAEDPQGVMGAIFGAASPPGSTPRSAWEPDPDPVYETARAAGQANAQACLKDVASELRAVLPTAHTLVVDTDSWASARGEARPDIRAVRDEHGTDLWDAGETSPEGVTLSDEINEVCTTLDDALRFCDPWFAPGWDRDPNHNPWVYTVTLPAPQPSLSTRNSPL